MSEEHFQVRTPWFRPYSEVRMLLTLLQGVSKAQVKRRQESIQRPILDQLRGALPYYKALRGTIITLGTFSSGCINAALYVGAAPISLIDGEKLFDLLIKYDIGVKKRPVDLYEIDEEYLRASDEHHEVDISLNEELV